MILRMFSLIEARSLLLSQQEPLAWLHHLFANARIRTLHHFSPTVPSHPVGIIPPRAKSPMSPPESSTIASYVTLRKTKKPEPKSVSLALWHQQFEVKHREDPPEGVLFLLLLFSCTWTIFYVELSSFFFPMPTRNISAFSMTRHFIWH